jgi:hypothetical protein
VWEWIHALWEWLSKSPPATVAVLAFVLALLTAWAQRKHNQLSVTPLVDVALGDYDKDLYVGLVNNGTGPALIKSITNIGAENPSAPLIDAMPELPRDDFHSLTYFSSDPDGRSIRAGGGAIRLLQLRYIGEEASKKDEAPEKKKASKNLFVRSRDKYRVALGPLTLHVVYTDIYKKQFETKRSLDHFRRRLPDQSPPPSDER